MPDASAIAARSMSDDLARLASISQNLANAATPGYKAELAVARPFAEVLQAATAAGPTSWVAPLPVLHTAIDQRAGALLPTGAALDVAIEGPGWFELAGPDGPVYTRLGRFRIDAQGRLTDEAGRTVVSNEGEIRLESPEPRIDRQGKVWDGSTLAGQLKVVTFDEPRALQPLGAGTWSADDQPAREAGSVSVRQGHLEASNVETTQQMVRLIETMRRFEANQKLIQGYDDVVSRAVRTLGGL